MRSPCRSFRRSRVRALARNLTRGEAARDDLGVVQQLVNDVLRPNYGWLQWVITFVEVMGQSASDEET